MSTEEHMSPGDTRTVTAGSVVIRVDSSPPALKAAGRRILVTVLTLSILMNLMFVMRSAADASGATGQVSETHHSGTRSADAKLAVINFSGTIMPPFTERWLKQIERATEDPDVKGVLLAVDSPGGLVADSHQIYHELQKLREKKPIYVAMKRLAASGGYYLSMGIGTQGRIFVEPTTWTGSIGVIIPRYNASELASRIGVAVEPLATGPMKDSLNPFRELSDQEREVWDLVLQDSFDRFVGVIVDNRAGLDEQQVRALATGQIYTASQAITNGLADEVGFEEDALEALATAAGVTDYEVVEYSSPPTLMDLLLSGKAESSDSVLAQLMDATVPRAMYYCSWNPWVPTSPQR
ncbi:MAG: signal peptide peptidase SppA [Fuerstiella sp.]